jgi:hypothetical protein
MVYAADPWAVMQTAVQEQCRQSDVQVAASFIRQAQEYFRAAEAAHAIETKPVLYYYSFLNLAKALGLARKQPNLIGTVHHGLHHDYVAGERITTAKLRAHSNTGTKTNVFDVLHSLLTERSLASNTALEVSQLMPQSIIGHRLWCEAGGASRRERFLHVSKLALLEDEANRTIWITIELPRDTLQRHRRTLVQVARDCDLQPDWRPVTDGIGIDGRPCRRFEQTNPITYSHRAADEVVSLVRLIKPKLRRTILGASPYRRYYLYMAPAGEQRLPQLLVVHALMFFLGSIARYRPSYLLSILDGDHGGFLREFLATQPLQYVYEIASEFLLREVSRAEVV